MREPMTLQPQRFHPPLHQRKRMTIPLIVQLLEHLRRKLQLQCHACTLADDLRCVSKSAIPSRGQYSIHPCKPLRPSTRTNGDCLSVSLPCCSLVYPLRPTDA